jgi:hypothetical protein
MFPLLQDVSLNADQCIAATRLLLRIAHVDGAKTNEEVALIRLFYDGGRNGSADWPAFATLEEDGRGGDLTRIFGEAAERDLVLATCLMVAYADGLDRRGTGGSAWRWPTKSAPRRPASMSCSPWSRITCSRTWPGYPMPARWPWWRANSAEVHHQASMARVHRCPGRIVRVDQGWRGRHFLEREAGCTHCT